MRRADGPDHGVAGIAEIDDVGSVKGLDAAANEEGGADGDGDGRSARAGVARRRPGEEWSRPVAAGTVASATVAASASSRRNRSRRCRAAGTVVTGTVAGTVDGRSCTGRRAPGRAGPRGGALPGGPLSVGEGRCPQTARCRPGC